MDLKKIIRNIPDFPKQGIQFKDVESILEKPAAFSFVINQFSNAVDGRDITKIVGLDARGFLFAAALGFHRELPVVMARKKGKLGGETVSEIYALEYGEAEVEMQKTALAAGERVVIVDDLLATGGTASATARLVEKLGGEVDLFAFVIELEELSGRKRLNGKDILSLVNY